MRRPQRGQALLVVLAFIASLCAAFLVVVSTGQLVNDKIRLTNAADAAAFSAATWEARSLNYQAYLNRAIVANEVAIAQLVSLRSWSRYMETLTDNASTVAGFIPGLAGPMQALARGWDGIDRAIGGTAPVLEASLSHWNTHALLTAQSVAHQQAPIAAANLLTQVVEANEPRAVVADATRTLQARNAAVWQHRFTERYERGGTDLRRFTTLLMNSRDTFTRSRSANLPIPGVLISVPRRGGTDLIGEYTWRGIDTMSVHIDALLDSVEIPLGWGAAEQRRQATSRRGDHGGSLRRNPSASRRAQRTLLPREGYLGVPQIRDVVNVNSAGPRSLVYSVALQLPVQRVLTDRLLMPGSMPLLEGGAEPVTPPLSADALHAIGSAEIYFQRPALRADGRQEHPSLFNPYWQVRLVQTPAVERQLTASARGLTVDPFAVLP